MISQLTNQTLVPDLPLHPHWTTDRKGIAPSLMPVSIQGALSKGKIQVVIKMVMHHQIVINVKNLTV